MWKYDLLQVLLWCSKVLNSLCKLLFSYSFYSGWQDDKLRSWKNQVHRCRILWRAEPTLVLPFSSRAFLLIHNGCANLDYVLKNKSISLLCIEQSRAVFVSIPEKINPYDTQRCGPFFYMNQFHHADEVITVSLDSFLALSKRAKMNHNVIWISNTSRSGSTLLTQMLARAQKVTTISEPDFLLDFMTFDSHKRLQLALIEAAIKMMLHPLADQKTIVIKTRGLATYLTAKIATLFPEIRHIFNYRDPVDNIASLVGLSSAAPNLDRKLDTYRYYFPRVLPDGCGEKSREMLKTVIARLDSQLKMEAFSWGVKMLAHHHYMVLQIILCHFSLKSLYFLDR